MLLLFEKGIRGGICQAVTKYKKANNKYMKNYDSNKPSSYLMYVDANNLYGYAMSNKLPYGNFKWVGNISIFTGDFIKNYNENSDTGYLLIVDVTYPQNLHESHKYLPFLPVKTKIDKVTKLSCNSNDNKYYPVHISTLKQASNHGLKLETVHNAISFSQDASLKPYIHRNTKFGMKASNEFEKDYYKLLNNSFYGKSMENNRKHRDIRLVNTENKRSKLACEPNCYSTKHISEDLLIMEMKKRNVYMNKPLYLGQAILDYSKMLMYEFWYDYLRPMYGDKIELCYMDTDSFIIYVETEYFHKDISNDVDKWFDTNNFSKDVNRPLEKGKNKKVIDKFKDELGGLIISEFCAHRPKTYAFLIDGVNDYKKHGIINKKAKDTKKCVKQNQITFNDYVNLLFNKTKLIKSQFGFRSTNHDIYTGKINKIALSFSDNKRIQCSDTISTYPYDYNTKDIIDYNNLIDKVHIANNRCNNVSKDTDTFLEDVDVLLNRMNKLKDKSKKRMEHSNKLLEEYKAINDKIDTNIEKTKIVRASCEINMLIESTNELIKRTNDNCEKTMYF